MPFFLSRFETRSSTQPEPFFDAHDAQTREAPEQIVEAKGREHLHDRAVAVEHAPLER
jgi:hypothetical protein